MSDEIDSIITAARQGKTGEVKWFLECGENVNATAGANKRTALHEAAMNGHCECISVLLNAQAEIEARDALGYTPLHVAISKRQSEAVKLLLDRGANIHAVDDKNRDSLTLADTFCGRTSDLTKYLIKRELEIKKQQGPGKFPIDTHKVEPSTKEHAVHHHPHTPSPTTTISQPPPKPTYSKKPTEQSPSTTTTTEPRNPPKIDESTSTRPKAASLSTVKFVVVVYKEQAVAVVKVEDEDFLTDVRDRMEGDEVKLNFPFLFLFQKTGATITMKQERTFPLVHCCYMTSSPNTDIYYIDIANVNNLDPSLWKLDDKHD